MTNGIFTNVMGWLKQPFTSTMDVTHWFLFVLLVVIAFIFWTRILRDVTR